MTKTIAKNRERQVSILHRLNAMATTIKLAHEQAAARFRMSKFWCEYGNAITVFTFGVGVTIPLTMYLGGVSALYWAPSLIIGGILGLSLTYIQKMDARDAELFILRNKIEGEELALLKRFAKEVYKTDI